MTNQSPPPKRPRIVLTKGMMVAILLIDFFGILGAIGTYVVVENKRYAIVPIIISTIAMGLVPFGSKLMGDR